jgi:asparagine synthase (glutamine-hydrolysing)
LRATRLGLESIELLAGDAGVRLVHPIAEEGFTAALAAAAPPGGPPARGRFMAWVLGDALPSELLLRATKASFDEAFWGPDSRSLIDRWSGEGADLDLVDTAGLGHEWSAEVPDAHTFTLLQAAWLELELRRSDLSTSRDELREGIPNR